MIIAGLEHTAYYLLNPIWVDVSDVGTKINFSIKINGDTTSFNLYPFNGKLRFDLSELILGVVPNVRNKDDLIAQMDGAFEIDITITDGIQSQNFTKYFLLGGVKSLSSNVVVDTNLSLHSSAWDGYPAWISRFIGGQIINIYQENSPTYPDLTWLRPRVDCNNVFFAFRNKKAGFSFYLFEDFNIIDENKDKGYYLTPYDPKTMGIETKLSIAVRSKVKSEFYETINSLADSFEIYLYNSDRIIDTDDNWVRLVGSNNVNFNPKNTSTDISLNFDVVTNLLKVW